MRFIIIIFLFLTLLFAQNMSEKLVISADENSTSVQRHLLKLKMFFSKNEQAKVLLEKYQLSITLETLDDYTMLVVKPIYSLELKNELLHLLSSQFPDIFSMAENPVKKVEKKEKHRDAALNTKREDPLHFVEKLMHTIGLQWVALLFLSLVGLFLSINSRNKMANLESMQRELSQKQEEIENEIKQLGATRD